MDTKNITENETILITHFRLLNPIQQKDLILAAKALVELPQEDGVMRRVTVARTSLFAPRFRKALQKRGASIEDLVPVLQKASGLDLEVELWNLSHCLSGTSLPTKEDLDIIAQYLGVTPDWLMGRTD